MRISFRVDPSARVLEGIARSPVERVMIPEEVVVDSSWIEGGMAGEGWDG